MMTHRELCKLAARHLQKKGIKRNGKCQYVVCELERAGECPDAFGFGGSHSQLVEVKVSRSDFLSDKKKSWRKNPELGIGEYRSYLCPSGVIGKEDLPEKWGLLWGDEDGNIVEIAAPQPQASNNFEEMQLAASLLRRNGITPKIFDYKKYKYENIRANSKPIFCGNTQTERE